MDPRSVPSRAIRMQPAGDDIPSGAELVVQNGRLSGARRPLDAPITLVGSDESCDIRLNVEGVAPQHCVLARTATGVVIRDCGGESGTLVNGVAITLHQLSDGDLLTVGPFRFRIRLAERERV